MRIHNVEKTQKQNQNIYKMTPRRCFLHLSRGLPSDFVTILSERVTYFKTAKRYLFLGSNPFVLELADNSCIPPPLEFDASMLQVKGIVMHGGVS